MLDVTHTDPQARAHLVLVKEALFMMDPLPLHLRRLSASTVLALDNCS